MTAREAAIVASLDGSLRALALEHRRRTLELGIPFVFTSGARSSAEQEAACRRAAELGVPCARPGSSKHLLGMAYDFDGPRSSYEWGRAGRIAEQLGLEWGGRYGDPYHVEDPRPFAELAAARRNRRLAAAAALVLVPFVVR